jgi:hypothetical protein
MNFYSAPMSVYSASVALLWTTAIGAVVSPRVLGRPAPEVPSRKTEVRITSRAGFAHTRPGGATSVRD